MRMIARMRVGPRRKAVEERMGVDAMIEVVATERITKTTDGDIGRDHDHSPRKLNPVLDHGPARLVVIKIGTLYEHTQNHTQLDQIVHHTS